MRYSKLLIGKFSAENGCYAKEGAILTVLPKRVLKRNAHVSHNFVDSLDGKTQSRYGWVKSVAPFTLNDFITDYCAACADEIQIEHIKVMLDSITNLEDGTPVAATYSERGVENKRMDFTVHKVFFHK